MVDFPREAVVLNIKNPDTYRLAKLLAERTGVSMTTAVTIAIKEKLERIAAQTSRATTEEIVAIGQRCAAELKYPPISIDEYLYGEDGLPR